MRSFLTVAVIAIEASITVSAALCQTNAKRGNWQNVEADNGAIYKIDLNSISHYNNGTADVVVYAVEGSGYNPENTRRLWFDCQGRYRDSTGPKISSINYAPPRSIAWKMSQIACAGANNTQAEDASRPPPKDNPSQYCAGFAPDACARISAVVEANRKPDYCRPGFALVGSGLSHEEVRICSVISSEEVRSNNQKGRLTGKPPQSRTYDLTLSATRSNFPNILGSTNLPDGTKLMVSIEKPRLPNAGELQAAGLPMCEDNCFPASGPKGEVLGVATVVQAGAFSSGPFSWAGKPIKNGNYKVDIFLVSLPDEDVTSREYHEMLVKRMGKPIMSDTIVISR